MKLIQLSKRNDTEHPLYIDIVYMLAAIHRNVCCVSFRYVLPNSCYVPLSAVLSVSYYGLPSRSPLILRSIVRLVVYAFRVRVM
ncbi:hypothetical protein R6Q59_011318 [Mikania micrantha]